MNIKNHFEIIDNKCTIIITIGKVHHKKIVRSYFIAFKILSVNHTLYTANNLLATQKWQNNSLVSFCKYNLRLSKKET